MKRDSRISHSWRQAALTHELALDLLPRSCLRGLPGPGHRHVLCFVRIVLLGEPIDLFVDQMVVRLFAESEQDNDRSTCSRVVARLGGGRPRAVQLDALAMFRANRVPGRANRPVRRPDGGEAFRRVGARQRP